MILTRVLCSLFVFCASNFGWAQVVINEICAANADLAYDPQFYNFSGWVEIYNPTAATVDVSNYFLSDSETELKWQFPIGTTIAANGFLIIWCDKKNTGLHTNFNLDSDGEVLVLADAGQVQLDKIVFPKQYTNVSYGRLTDGGNVIGYMTTPTLSAQNNNATGTEQLVNPIASVSSGRYETNQLVVLSHVNPGASIRYTTDGSEPMPTSVLYTGAISITKTTTLKAKAFAPGFIPSKSEVKTYFIDEHTFTLPVVSISTNPSYLWDNLIGIYVEGTNGIKGSCSVTPVNWNQDWHRHTVFEYFDITGKKQFDQGVNIRIAGNCTRRYAQKSLVVEADDKYGKNNINEILFPNKTATRYHSFILRNSGNDFNVTLFRDALIQHIAQRSLEIDFLDYQPTIFYLNGEYWGIQNMREKADAEYIETNYGISADDIDLIENRNTVLDGSYTAFNTYFQTLKSLDRSTPTAFTHIDTHIDVQKYINYLATQIYICNTDWPDNNQKYWRQVSTKSKFRWILWDTDFGLGLFQGRSYPTFPSLSYAAGTDPAAFGLPAWSTEHIRYVLENPEFRQRFIQTLIGVMNTSFGPANFNEQLGLFQNRIKDEVPVHKTRWGGDVADWNAQIEKLKLFVRERQRYMPQHMAEFFGLGETLSLCIKANPAGAASFTLNGVKSTTGFDNGVYFKGLGYRVQAEPLTGYVFDHWKITSQPNVAINLIKIADEWKYFDQGSLPAANWYTAAYSDAAWLLGKGQFGYGDQDEETVISYGPDASSKFVTSYFRKTVLIDALELSNLDVMKAAINFDDGVVVYVNGTEVYRNNLPTTSINYNTLATKNFPTENEFVEFTFDKGLLTEGENIIAVEVHQSAVNNSDLSFDFQLFSNKPGTATETTATSLDLTGSANENLIFEAFYNLAPVVTGLVINELGASKSAVLDDHDEQEDWIELYNTTSSAIDVAGLYITDNFTNKTKYKIPAGGAATTIQPYGYTVLWADEQPDQGPLHLDIKLSADGEAVGLYQQVGSDLLTIDETSFPVQQNNFSYARIPNGIGPFYATAELTPGAENSGVVALESNELRNVLVYPNPTRDQITVSANVPLQLQVLDIMGRITYQMASVSVSSVIVPLPIEPGLYILQLKTAQDSKTLKIIKH